MKKAIYLRIMKHLYLIVVLSLLSLCSSGQATLVAHWDFNGNTNDVTGNGLNGIGMNLTPAAGFSGNPNTAYSFNGTSSGIDVPYNPLMNLNTWSIHALIKPLGYYQGPCQANYILSRGHEYTDDYYATYFLDNPYDLNCTTFYPDSQVIEAMPAGNMAAYGPEFRSGYFIHLNTWYCLAATYANDTVKVYFNGMLAAAVHWTYQYGAGTTAALSIGYYNYGLPTYPYWFNGIMDDVRLYNGVLSQPQLDSLCNALEVVTPGTIVYDFSSNVICNTAAFNASYISGNAASQYSWSFGDNTNGTGNPATHSYASGGTYTVTLIVNDTAGNADTITHQVTVSSGNFNYAISNNLVGCRTIQLNANYMNGDTATQFLWIFGDNSPTGSGSQVTHTYSQSGTYDVKLVLTSALGCIDTVTTQVIINTNISYSITYTQLNCRTARLIANHISGDTTTQYVWLFGDNTPNGAGNPVTHSYPQNGSYIARLAVMNSAGCTDTISLPVSLAFDINYSIADSGIDCKTAQLTATHLTGDTAAQFQWLFANGDTASSNPVIHTFPNTGANTADLVMVNSLGCRDTMSYNFTILYQLFADFTFTPDPPEKNKPVQFHNASSPAAVKFSWDFGDSTHSAEENPLKLYDRTGVHKVCLTATDSNDCSATACKDILADVTEIIDIPDAFSPNGDGINDVLFARGFGVATMTLSVYNRWGQKIFTSTGLQVGWDGTYKSKPQPDEAYAYVIDAVFVSGRTFHKQGNVSILR